nr:hypothetical protein [Treponema sp.]
MLQQIELFPGTANMKKINIFLSLVTFLLLLFCSFSCRQEIADDEDVFKSFEPLEWSDDYVFAATNEPDSIQVWDSKTHKLVRVYKFYDEKDNQSFLEIQDINVLEKSILFIATRKKTSLVKFDIETGTLNFMKLDFSPYSLSPVMDFKNNEEVIWVNSFGHPKYGMDFAMFTDKGELRRKLNIKSENLQGTVAGNIFCEDGTFYIYGDGFKKTTDEESLSCLSLINLDAEKLQDIDNRIFFPKGFLAKEFKNIDIPDYMIGIDLLDFEGKK